MVNNEANRPKQLLIQRLRSVRAVLWAVDTFGERLRNVDRTFAVYLRGRLVQQRSRLVRAERHLRQSEIRRSWRIVQRNNATRALRRLLVTARGSSVGVFGEMGMLRIGFARRISEDAETLLEQAIHVRDRVLHPAFDAPEPLIHGLTMNWEEFGAELTLLIKSLRKALDNVNEARTDVGLALHERNEILAEFNKVFLHSARIVENALRSNGFDDLADRVRPSTRRPGLTEVPFVEEGSSSELIADHANRRDVDSGDPQRSLESCPIRSHRKRCMGNDSILLDGSLSRQEEMIRDIPGASSGLRPARPEMRSQDLPAAVHSILPRQ